MELVFLQGPRSGSRCTVVGTMTLGRGPANDISLPDEAVSLVHCEFSAIGKDAAVKDLGSTNGIWVNGRRVVSSHLQHEDVLVIGQSHIRVVFSPEGLSTSGEQPQLRAQVKTIRDPQRTRPSSPVEDREELSGNIFGKVTYFLKRKLADGGMGSVYEAEQFGAEGFIKRVAIKTILPSYAQRESFVQSFVGEAKLVANLVHQNIVQIHHLGRHDNGYYISMEFIDGVNLTYFLDCHRRLRQQVPVDLATFIISRICRGLEYAHNKQDDHGRSLGLVHRDVSPNNIMITREGEVKLTDFGVARAAQFMEDDEEYLVGSVEYMSPEQASCQPIDGRSDLFSLGLVYYELLTGLRVMHCESEADLDAALDRVQEAEIPDPCRYRADLSISVKALLLRCLAKEPAHRFQTAGELSYALEHEIYSKGYGPTIVSLAAYVKDLVAGVGWRETEAGDDQS